LLWRGWDLAEDGFVGFDFGGAGEEVFVFGEHGEGIGLIEVDVEGFFGGVAGEEEEEVFVGGGAVEAVIEVAGLGAGDGDAVSEFAFEVGGLAGLGAEADGDDVLLFGLGHSTSGIFGQRPPKHAQRGFYSTERGTRPSWSIAVGGCNRYTISLLSLREQLRKNEKVLHSWLRRSAVILW